ncbi:MAG: cysteine dioxygenase family protein [Planctomycetaceae bacterium]
MRSSLSDFLTTIDGHRREVPLGELSRLLVDVDVDLSRLGPYLRFHPERYQRNLLCGGDAYHALLLCWRAGQRSPIHDHRGSNCAFRVLRGVATESTFERTSTGLVYPVESRRLTPGRVCASSDSDIHQVSNLEPSEDLVTLHVYSPPLLVMGQYTLMTGVVSDFIDPVFEFSSGSGI